MPALELIVANL
jgi:dynein heavy chain, axonemal